MIHTIIDLNEVFANSEEPEIFTEPTNGGYAEYITVNGKKRLRRLFSTRPQDYLGI